MAINNGSATDIDVTLKDLTINNSSDLGRPIETRGHINSFALDRCKINATGNGNNQAITIGGSQSTAAKLTVTDTSIAAGPAGYPMLTFNPIDLTMNGGNLSGYCGIYFKGESSSAGSRGSVANICGTTYYCPNVHSAEGSNDFGIFAIEDDGITINLTDCNLNGQEQNTAKQAIFQLNSYAKRQEQLVKAAISGNSVVTGTILDNGWNRENLFDLEISKGQFSEQSVSQYTQNPLIQFNDPLGNDYFIGNAAEINVFVSENSIKDITVLKGNEITVPKGIHVKNAAGNDITVNGEQVIKNNQTAHIHDFVLKNTNAKYLAQEATCTQPAEYYYSCDCGAAGTKTFTSGNVARHTFENGKCTVCGTLTAEVEDIPSIDTSKPYESIQVGVDKTNTEKLEQEVASVADAIINDIPTAAVSKETAEKVKKAIENGTVVHIEVNFDNTISVTENIKDLTNNILKKDETIGTYFDLSILLKANDEELGTLTKLSKSMTFHVSIPADLIKEGRNYFIIRVHDGVAERLNTVWNNDGTLSFETDRFSTYALAYSDSKDVHPGDSNVQGSQDNTDPSKGSSPQTGDNSNITLWIAAILAACAVLIGTAVFI